MHVIKDELAKLMQVIMSKRSDSVSVSESGTIFRIPILPSQKCRIRIHNTYHLLYEFVVCLMLERLSHTEPKLAMSDPGCLSVRKAGVWEDVGLGV
jgi:hypothetical protein